ncbi:polyketide synthase [Gigaspora margarita]|uniref:Polyketide synthase n=1 Tax=Gigaspora margarita TaxID=4874 RepID=A0A8H4ENS6_GIGMA|nr:polyketide synthase [Gigaspora margarita]
MKVSNESKIKINGITTVHNSQLNGNDMPIHVNGTSSDNKDMIAIVGMAGCFPGAKSVDELWEMVTTGKNALHRFTDKELEQLGIPASLRSNSNYVPTCGLLADIDKFDANFFNINAQDAVNMDPQQRLLLEKSVQALDDAGIDPRREKGKIGVFIATEYSKYKELIPQNNIDLATKLTIDINYMPGSSAAIISYLLNLTGPAFSTGSTCSSSLTALKTAYNSIKSEDCDIAIVGASWLELPQAGYIAQPGFIYSANGTMRPFDHKSDGTIFTSSVSVIVLKKLSNAIRDQNPISSIIKSIAINNDGQINKVGYSAPSSDGQCDVIKRTLQLANVSPSEIAFIEAHGTGTKIGDPVEIKALTKAFVESSQELPKQFCPITTVKSNIGHCVIASGLAGIIKTVKSLENRVIPPMASGSFEKPNKMIDFESSPFYVATKLQKFEEQRTMYASVHGIGMGGTNVHCILAEYLKNSQKTEEHFDETDKFILPFSAKSQASLLEIEKKMIVHLEYLKDENALKNIEKTLQIGRSQYIFRDVVVASSISDAISQLKMTKITQKVKFSSPNIIFAFPGQGKYSITIHRQLYRSSKIYREKFMEYVRILQNYDPTVPNLGNYLLDTTQELDIKYYPLMVFMSSHIIADILQKVLKYPIAGMIGHSLGQYVAATLAGIFTIDIALPLVLERTNVMYKMEKGLMLAANISKEIALNFVKTEKISLAAVNEPGQCVFAGSPDDIKDLAKTLKECGYKVKQLSTTHAFHSHMTDSILDEFENKIYPLISQAAKYNQMINIPFISNESGDWTKPEEAFTTNFWRTHIRKTVQFESGIKTIQSTIPNAIFVEVGLEQVLNLFIQNILNYEAIVVHGFDPKNFSIEKLISDSWCNGIEIDWHAYYNLMKPSLLKVNLIRLPTYQFDHSLSYWPQKSESLINNVNEVFDIQNQHNHVQIQKQETGLSIKEKVIMYFRMSLGIDNINEDSDFFEAGGNSLKTINLLALLNKGFGIHFNSTNILLSSPTPKSLTAFIKDKLMNIKPIDFIENESCSSLITLNHGNPNIFPSIYMIHPVGGSCGIYYNMAKYFGNIPVYGFEFPGLQNHESNSIKYNTVQQYAQNYLTGLLKVNPHGPYYLFGSSFGGIVAYEMACELMKRKKYVKLVAMVDTPSNLDMPTIPTTLLECLHHIYSLNHDLTELNEIGNEEEKLLKYIAQKILPSAHQKNHIETSTLKYLKGYFNMVKFDMNAIKDYQLPISSKPFPIMYFKAKIRRDSDSKYPEKAWRELQEMNKEDFEYIELDGNHMSVNFFPTCEIIANTIVKKILCNETNA